MSLINLNGKIINEEKAFVSINNRSFRYGDGFFETIRIINGKIPLWQYHYERLMGSLITLQFLPPSFYNSDFFLEKIISLAIENGHQQCARVRLNFFRGNGGLYDPENHFPNYIIQSWPLNEAVLNTNGLICGIYQNGFKAADIFANIKSNNFLLYAMAALHAKQHHWNDALILNHKGSVADATIANLFIIKNKIIITPPLTDGPVNGTMRRYLLEQLKKNNYTIKEQSIYPEDVLAADEVFLTNAITGIRWVKQITEKEYGFNEIVHIYRQIMQPLFT